MKLVIPARLNGSSFFGFSGIPPADWRLNVVRSVYRLNSIAPHVGSKLGERESRVMGDDALAKIGSRLPLTPRAQIEVVDVRSDSVGEQLSIGRLGCLKVGSEIHVATNQSVCSHQNRSKRFSVQAV